MKTTNRTDPAAATVRRLNVELCIYGVLLILGTGGIVATWFLNTQPLLGFSGSILTLTIMVRILSIMDTLAVIKLLKPSDGGTDAMTQPIKG